MATGGDGSWNSTLPVNWKKGECLSQGIFGKTYIVQDKDKPWDEAKFVVKDIRINTKNHQIQEKLKTGIDSLKTIQHYSLVSVLDFQTEGDVLSIFSSYMTEGSLADYIRKGPISESKASTFTHQLIEGVKYLHNRGIVHHHIKCKHLLLTSGHYVKLTGFEFMCFSKTTSENSCSWIAPEVLNVQNNKKDIWSIGSVVVEMITGQPPLPGQNMSHVTQKLSQQADPEYELPAESSKALNDFLRLTLQKLPENRPCAADLIKHDFPQGILKPLPALIQRGEAIGSGTFGTVYLLKDPDRPDDNFFVVKKIKIKERNELNRECDILRRIKHYRIVSFFGTHEKKNALLLIFPYLTLGSLDKYMKTKGPIEEERAWWLIRQVVQGVSYLHSRNIIHRDIKGANVLLATEDEVKLTDFGISKVLEKLYGTNTKEAGTTRWMAPEVLLGEHYGVSADIWSVGCIFVEMITGKPPFHGLINATVMYKISQRKGPVYKLPEGSTSYLETFLSKTFEWDPSKRPTADWLLENDLSEDQIQEINTGPWELNMFFARCLLEREQ